jgi:SAM-dependent methyltransferase
MDERVWEDKYKIEALDDLPLPAALLQKNAHLIAGGKALDIAMGAGQNAVFLASRGCDVTGVDRSESAVAIARRLAARDSLDLTAVTADVLTYPLPESCFDVIINFYFLERSLVTAIKQSLKQRGLLFFETYTIEQVRFGRPRNPDHLLKPNELLAWFLDFFIIFYHERVEEGKAIASLIAQKI